MELVTEIFLEIYMELMFLIIPEENVCKKHIVIAKIVAIMVTLSVITLFVLGMVLIFEKQNLWGIAPTAVAITVSLAQIIAGFVLFKKHH